MDKLGLELIGRWLERDDAENLWRDLKSALPTTFEITPALFAAQVMERRVQAAQIAEIFAENPDIVERALRKLKHDPC
jgi:hypothetical protein